MDASVLNVNVMDVSVMADVVGHFCEAAGEDSAAMKEAIDGWSGDQLDVLHAAVNSFLLLDKALDDHISHIPEEILLVLVNEYLDDRLENAIGERRSQCEAAAKTLSDGNMLRREMERWHRDALGGEFWSWSPGQRDKYRAVLTDQ